MFGMTDYGSQKTPHTKIATTKIDGHQIRAELCLYRWSCHITQFISFLQHTSGSSWDAWICVQFTQKRVCWYVWSFSLGNSPL